MMCTFTFNSFILLIILLYVCFSNILKAGLYFHMVVLLLLKNLNTSNNEQRCCKKCHYSHDYCYHCCQNNNTWSALHILWCRIAACFSHMYMERQRRRTCALSLQSLQSEGQLEQGNKASRKDRSNARVGLALGVCESMDLGCFISVSISVQAVVCVYLLF